MKLNMQVNIKAEKTGTTSRPVRHQLRDSHGAPASPMGPVGAAIVVGLFLLVFATIFFSNALRTRHVTGGDGQRHNQERQQPASQVHP